MKKTMAIVTTVFMCFALLCACTPDVDALKEKFESNGYVATQIKGDYVLGTMKIETGYEQAFLAVKGLNNICVIVYSDGDAAKKMYDYYNSGDGVLLPGWKIIKKGNAVIFGTEEAIKLV